MCTGTHLSLHLTTCSFSLFALSWSLTQPLDMMLTVRRGTTPWAPELISLATVQASHRMGESAKGLPTDWETGVSPANPLAPQPEEC